MKLKPEFVTRDVEATQFMISLGGDSFSGLVRSNRTAAFIVNRLKTETTESAIVDAMCARYDAPRDVIAADVANILNTLRKIRALDE